MSRHALLLAFTATLVAFALTGCGSTGERSMSAEDKAQWMSAREQHGIGALDDKSFLVQLREAGQASDEDDLLEFAGGRFHSSVCDPHEFGSGAYTTKTVDGGIEFHATCTSPSGGTNLWHGTVRGDTIEGGFISMIPGEPTTEYSFHGTTPR